MDGVVLAAAMELPVHPVFFGVGVFVLMLVLLAITLAFGKGRPHS